MNEPGLNDQALPGDTGKEPPILVSPGARLAACRQERGWTIAQVAGQLNLAPRQVVAIEADDYPSLPGMAIVRGFVRQYAKLLKIDAAPLLASLGGETVLAHEPIRPSQNLSTPFSEARLPSMSTRSGASAKWFAAGAVVVAMGAVAYAVHEGVDFAGMSQSASSQVKDGFSQITTPSAPASQGDGTPPTSDAATVTPEPVNAQPPVEQAAGNGVNPAAQSAGARQTGDGAQQGSAASSQLPMTPPAAAPASTASTTPATATEAGAGDAGNTLVIKARQDSWIEIKAASGGKPILSRIIKAGETETLEVTDPLAVVIGNAHGVDATLRGNPVELKAPGNGNVARLTLK